MESRIILSLCDLTGTWSQPYVDAGYDVRRYDIQRSAAEDIRLIEHPGKVHGIIAQPPCTQFAASGARWWAQKAVDNPDYLTDALALVDACMRLVATTQPEWWVLENPVGRLKNWLGPYVMTFQPWEYAMHSSDPDADSYTKRTCLWGNFTQPERAPHPKKDGIHKGKMHRLPPSEERANLRSATPEGFARAFFLANQ
jgi:hypothetical protein